jgi:hypothetical protein
VSALDFDATLSGTREFLDRHRADPIRFETSSDGRGTILIRAEFIGSDLVELFRR